MSIRESMTAYEKTFAKIARLKEGMTVLDLGCGIGGPARTIASTIGCSIVGITNNAWHVERGTALNKQAELDHMVTLVEGDFLVCIFIYPPLSWQPHKQETDPLGVSETALPRRVL